MNIIMLCLFVLAVSIIISYFLTDKARFEKIINKKVGITCLGRMPFNTNNKNLLIDNNPKANVMKYIKDIRNNILKLTEKKVLAFISCNHGEGKSWVADNIAVSLARINKKVLLIDGNLRKISNKSQIFYAEEGEGLVSLITNIETEDKLSFLCKVKKSIKQTQIPYLYIIPNGEISENSYKLLRTDNFKQLLQLFKGMFDYVIIDGTSFFENDDCLELSSVVDTNILVVEKSKTRCSDIQKLKDETEEKNGNFLGYILNKTSLRFGKYYGKNIKHRYGTYIETTKKEENQISIENIITNPQENLPKEENHEELHREIREKIMIEDFINDIEVNFNLKFDNIEKNAKENADYLIQIMLQNNKKLNSEITKYNEKIDENIKSTQELLQGLKNVQEQLDILKNEKDFDKISFIEQSMSEIKNKIYDEKFETIYKKIDDLHVEDRIQEVKDIVYNIDFNEKIDEINKKIDNIDLDVKIEEINKKLDNMDFDDKIDEINKKIDNINFDDKIDEINKKINNMDFDDKIEEINEKIDNMDYDEKFEELKELIDESHNDKNIENTYNINDYIQENKKDNILNLGSLFIANRKKNKNVFSIEEPISYYDLERLATEIFVFGAEEDDEINGNRTVR